jgi:hypothetical protein
MATCRPTLFLLTVKEILLVHFIITNFRVAHKMLHPNAFSRFLIFPGARIVKGPIED